MTVALPPVELPDPTLSLCERIILETHPVELMIRVTDAENACEHGNLPFDRNPDCECWTRARTAALLGQAPLDDGCPGLDRAAALDLPVPQIPASGQDPPERTEHDVAVGSEHRWWQARITAAFREDHDQEVQVHTSPNGATPTTEPTTQEIHDWYMAEDERTMNDVSEQFGLSTATIKRQFDNQALSCKPRGGRRPTTSPPEAPPTETPATYPETPIEGIASTIVLLERELLALNLRRSKVEGAIETLRELA